MEKMPHPHSFDWLIILGGSQHIWDEKEHPWLPEEKSFILEALYAGKIILGICLGAQLLAEALGGKAFLNEHEEIGWREVYLTPEGKESFLFKGIPDPFIAFHWHSDHFSLPGGCTNLACNAPTPHQAFISNEFPAVGLQFHPDFSLETVEFFSREHGDKWNHGPFISPKEDVLAQTKSLPTTNWLMDALLDNMFMKMVSNSALSY